MTSEFSGFPAEGLQFMRDLAQNNNKAWFEANKQAYLKQVQSPAVALVEALGTRLNGQFPEIRYDARTNGAGSLMRIYRDTRFSADKSPYKTNIAMMFAPIDGKKMDGAGFGLQITPEDVNLVAGMFAFSKPMLESFRQAVLSDARGKALEAAAAKVQAAGAYTLGGQTYKRIPAGFSADHPRADWLKFTGLHVYSPSISLEVAQTPELVEVAMAHFMKMSPIQQWIKESL